MSRTHTTGAFGKYEPGQTLCGAYYSPITKNITTPVCAKDCCEARQSEQQKEKEDANFLSALKKAKEDKVRDTGPQE